MGGYVDIARRRRLREPWWRARRSTLLINRACRAPRRSETLARPLPRPAGRRGKALRGAVPFRRLAIVRARSLARAARNRKKGGLPASEKGRRRTPRAGGKAARPHAGWRRSRNCFGAARGRYG